MLARKIDASISLFPSGKLPFSVELLPKGLLKRYSDSQFDFYTPEELSKLSVLDRVAGAVDLIKLVPTLSKSVFQLVKSVHLIKLDNDAFDVSFSEPRLPFSIFVSVPKNRTKADHLRVAEAIVHEAMHLQLSLKEKLVPLTKSNRQKFYSPWKDQYRNSTGILHALYVFAVIESFYGHLELKRYHSPIDLGFMKSRRNEISLEIDRINGFARSRDLTDYGVSFTKRMLGV